jgi:hypothetical protein
MQSRGATLGRCQAKDKAQNAEIIDLDNGDADVIIIDEPGSPNQDPKFVRKETTSSPNCVISIDDDDDHESATDSNPQTSGSQYGVPRNSYGLDCIQETESLATGTSGSKDSTGVGFSDGEGSDCEILDDSSGSIRREWERAHSRKKMPPNKFKSTRCENVKHHSNKLFEDSFNDCFGDSSSSSSRNKIGLHEDGANSSVPNADSSENLSKEKVSIKRKPWYEKEHWRFVPGTHQEEIRERVSPFSIRPCSYGKCKSVLSDNVVRAPEKIVLEEEIAKEADNGVSSSEKLVEDEISEETDNGQTPEKMNVDKEIVKEASLDMENVMNDKAKEKGKPSRDVEPSLMQNGDIASEANMQGENIGEESALVRVPETNPGPEQACLVGGREKHKESEEYKRADEEEWASRQKQLKIQVGLVLGHVFFNILQSTSGKQFIIELIRSYGLHHRAQS